MIIQVRFVKVFDSEEKDFSTVMQWACYSERAVDMTTFHGFFDKIHSGIFVFILRFESYMSKHILPRRRMCSFYCYIFIVT